MRKQQIQKQDNSGKEKNSYMVYAYEKKKKHK